MTEQKSLLALLNGIARHDYYDDSDMTDDYLKGELYADMSDADFEHLTHKCRGIMYIETLLSYLIPCIKVCRTY